MQLTAHDKKVTELYTKDMDKYVVFYPQPHRNWGYWDRGARNQQEASSHLISVIAESAAIGPEDHVLDVGCGFGTGSVQVAGETQCASLTGIDIVEAHIAYARANYSRKENILFEVMSAIHLRFPETSFTKIIAVDSAVHFNTREKFFHEAHRVLGSKGKMVLLDIIQDARISHPFFKLVEKAMMAYWRLPAGNRYDSQAYRAKLETAGFVNVKIEKVSDKIFPGAFGHYSSNEFKNKVRSVYGGLELRIWQIMMKLIQVLQGRSGLDFFIISCEKP